MVRESLNRKIHLKVLTGCVKHWTKQMRLLLAQGPAFPLRQDLFIQENALTDTSTTLPKSIISMICIQAAFTPMILWKNIGRTGAGIFILTAILMRQSRCMRSCSLCLKVKTILF